MTRTQMLCILEFITNHCSGALARSIIRQCDVDIIKFIREIVVNILDGGVVIENREPFLKFRTVLEKICIEDRRSISKTTRPRTVLCSRKGLSLLKLLFATVQHRRFKR